jgi:hypothetical protein
VLCGADLAAHTSLGLDLAYRQVIGNQPYPHPPAVRSVATLRLAILQRGHFVGNKGTRGISLSGYTTGGAWKSFDVPASWSGSDANALHSGFPCLYGAFPREMSRTLARNSFGSTLFRR